MNRDTINASAVAGTVEKQLVCGTIKYELFLLDLKIKNPKYINYKIFFPTSIAHVINEM